MGGHVSNIVKSFLVGLALSYKISKNTPIQYLIKLETLY